MYYLYMIETLFSKSLGGMLSKVCAVFVTFIITSQVYWLLIMLSANLLRLDVALYVIFVLLSYLMFACAFLNFLFVRNASSIVRQVVITITVVVMSGTALSALLSGGLYLLMLYSAFFFAGGGIMLTIIILAVIDVVLVYGFAKQFSGQRTKKKPRKRLFGK